jgi:hypothetical protein
LILRQGFLFWVVQRAKLLPWGIAHNTVVHSDLLPSALTCS